DREIAAGVPSHIGIAGRVDRDAGATVEATTTQIGGVDQGRAGRIQLRHEGVREYATPESLLEGAGGGGKVGAVGWPGYVGIAGRVYRDAGGKVEAAAAQVGGVDQARAGRIQLCHEGVHEAAGKCRLGGADGGGEAAGGFSGDVGIAGRVDRNAGAT